MSKLFREDKLFWEDLVPGPLAACGPHHVTADEVRAFGADFDPQELHVGERGAIGNMVDGLIASGWHICAITMRLISDGLLRNTAFMGMVGCDEARWRSPLRPGDRVTVRPQLLELRQSPIGADVGLGKFRFELVTEDERVVMTEVAYLMFARRPSAPAGNTGSPV